MNKPFNYCGQHSYNMPKGGPPYAVKQENCPAVAEVYEKLLVVSIGVETLRYGIMMGEAYRNEYADWIAEITDPVAFAQMVANKLNDPEVFNATIGPLFDKFATEILESGADCVRLEETSEWRPC